METISREFRVALPWELLYADDLVGIAETEEDLIYMNKTKVMKWRTSEASADGCKIAMWCMWQRCW